MPRINPRYAPINRQERDKRENLIHPQKPSEVIEKMYGDFAKGVKKLQKQIKNGETEEELARARKHLGQQAWSLENNYGYDLKDFNLESLGILPSVGKILSRGK
jgi:hypothetical protein